MPMSVRMFEQTQARTRKLYQPDPAETTPGYRKAWAQAMADLSASTEEPNPVRVGLKQMDSEAEPSSRESDLQSSMHR